MDYLKKNKKTIKMLIAYLIATMAISVLMFIYIYASNADTVVWQSEESVILSADDAPFETGNDTYRKGIYDISVTYATDGYGMVRVECEEEPLWTVKCSNTLLPPYSNHVDTAVYVNGKSGSFNVTVGDVNSESGLNIIDVNIVRRRLLSATYSTLQVLGTLLFIGLIVFAVKLTVSDDNKDRRTIFVGMTAIIFLSSIGFMMSYIPGGHDVEFHLGRIAAIADGISNGQFPVRMYSIFANDYGYPIGIMYGDLFLYPAAVLNMLGVPLWKSYVIYAVSMNVLTALISYYVFKEISKDTICSLVGSGIYTLSLWRLNDLYLRAAVGEYTAMVFIPLVLLGGYLIVNSKDKDDNNRKILISLVVGYTGMIQSHMLTTVVTTVFLALICLIYLKRVYANGYIKTIVKSALITVLVNAGFLIPFIDYYVSHDFAIKHQGSMIQAQGAYFSQIFSVWGNYGEGSLSVMKDAGISNEMPLNIGLVMILIMIMLVYSVLSKQMNKSIRNELLTLGGFSAIAIWMSTVYFPYDSIALYVKPLALLLNRVQFPWRYLLVATLLLSMAAVIIFKALKISDNEEVRRLYIPLLVLICGLSIWSSNEFISQCIGKQESVIAPLDETQIMAPLIDNDTLYFPNDMDLEQLEDKSIKVSSGDLNVENLSRRGIEFDFDVINQSGDAGFIELPLINNKGYVAYGDGIELFISDALIERLHVDIPSGYNGRVSIRFKAPWYWRVCEIISLICVIGLITYGMRLNFSVKKVHEKTDLN